MTPPDTGRAPVGYPYRRACCNTPVTLAEAGRSCTLCTPAPISYAAEWWERRCAERRRVEGVW